MKRFPKFAKFMMLMVVGLIGYGCAPEPPTPVPGQPTYEDVLCDAGGGAGSGHNEGPNGEIPCSRTDTGACGGQPTTCHAMAYGMCGAGGKSFDYVCKPNLANGTVCIHPVQCASKNCNNGTCGTAPVMTTPDGGGTGLPTCEQPVSNVRGPAQATIDGQLVPCGQYGRKDGKQCIPPANAHACPDGQACWTGQGCSNSPNSRCRSDGQYRNDDSSGQCVNNG